MRGFFGKFGGAYVAETLVKNLSDLEREFEAAKEDLDFRRELDDLLRRNVGRPTPLTPLMQLNQDLGGAKIYLKREDLAHTGAHKINNAIGQALLAKRMNKNRIIAETGAGQHGVAVATACGLLGMKCVIYMGAYDAKRQELNVKRMELLGAEVRLVHNGTQTLKDAINEAIRDWITHAEDSHYLLGSVVGPHPFPQVVRYFQSVIGAEAKEQILEEEGRLPDCVIACVGGGSNSIGMFSAFLDDSEVKLMGVEAAGSGMNSGLHAASLQVGRPGILQGSFTYLMQDEDGRILETRSIAPGLDYPGVGPEHSYLKDLGRVEYRCADDHQALNAFQVLSRSEGIIPALESSHAVAIALELAPAMKESEIILVNLSGRGDKDVTEAVQALEDREGKGVGV